MKRSAVIGILTVLYASAMWADENTDRALKLENSGDAAGARIVLAKAVQSAPSDLGALTAYAAFLERYGDPEARTHYRQLLTLSNGQCRSGCLSRRRWYRFKGRRGAFPANYRPGR